MKKRQQLRPLRFWGLKHSLLLYRVVTPCFPGQSHPKPSNGPKKTSHIFLLARLQVIRQISHWSLTSLIQGLSHCCKCQWENSHSVGFLHSTRKGKTGRQQQLCPSLANPKGLADRAFLVSTYVPRPRPACPDKGGSSVHMTRMYWRLQQ